MMRRSYCKPCGIAAINSDFIFHSSLFSRASASNKWVRFFKSRSPPFLGARENGSRASPDRCAGLRWLRFAASVGALLRCTRLKIVHKSAQECISWVRFAPRLPRPNPDRSVFSSAFSRVHLRPILIADASAVSPHSGVPCKPHRAAIESLSIGPSVFYTVKRVQARP